MSQIINDKFFATRKAIVVRKKNAQGKYESGPNSFIVIPPLNANPRVKGIIPEISPQKARIYRAQTVPENYSLFEDSNINQKLTPILNQEMCGSCWAFSLASSLGDSYVVSGILDSTPNISPTSILSQVKGDAGNGCEGGLPSKAAIMLSDIQTYSDNCMDYGWCNNNQSCGVPSGNPDESSLTSLIPLPKCVSNQQNKLGFSIKKDSPSTSVDPNVIKAHIMTVGPVVGCYMVPKNFSQYNKNTPNEAIYIETIDPTTGEFISISDSDIEGGHAVRVIGWGISKNPIKYNKDKPAANIPYWVIANSWGTSWGIDGTFKLAMYPYNNLSAIDNPESEFGGVVMFNPDQPTPLGSTYYPDKTYIPDNSTEEENYFKNNMKIFNSPDTVKKGNGPSPGPSPSGTSTSFHMKWIIIILVVIAIIFGVYYLRNKKTTTLSFRKRL